MKTQKYIVTIEMPDGYMISSDWLKDLIESDCYIEEEDEDRFSISVEEISTSEDLEEVAKEKYPVYWKDYPKDGLVRSESSYDTNKKCRDAFIAGAEWQEKQDLKWAAEIHKNGYNLCKEQMLKDAVDATVKRPEGHYQGYVEIIKFVDKSLQHGDKVKIVIIPEKEDKE